MLVVILMTDFCILVQFLNVVQHDRATLLLMSTIAAITGINSTLPDIIISFVIANVTNSEKLKK